MRHPRTCRWSQERSGCKWKGCEYLHVTLTSDDDQRDKALKYLLALDVKTPMEMLKVL